MAVLMVVALAATAMLVQPPASAAHKWSKLLLSRHGTSWSTSLTVPLFNNGFVWVPGCAPVRTFYAKNQSGEKAQLKISMRVTDPSGWLTNDKLRIAIKTGSGDWVRVRRTRQQTAKVVVAKGEVVPIAVRVRLLSSAGNKTMDRRLDFTVEVRLSQRRSMGD